MSATSTVTTVTAPGDETRASWPVRIRARMQAGRLDRDLDRGIPVVCGSALAAHAERIVSATQRGQLAVCLQLIQHRAHAPDSPLSARIPLRRRHILDQEPIIDEITTRLWAARPVRARGVARLRLLLADGLGPLYASGSGSLAAALRGVLAAL